MPTKELPELTAAGALTGDEDLYLVDGSGNSRRVSLSDIKTFVNTDPTVVPSADPFRGARVKRSTNLSVSGGSSSAVAWEAADRDTDSFWSAGSPTRLTVPAGITKVVLRASAKWPSNGSGVRYAWVEMNGASFAGQGFTTIAAFSGNFRQGFTSSVIDVAENDYFEMVVFQNSGGALNLEADPATWFEIAVVEHTL